MKNFGQIFLILGLSFASANLFALPIQLSKTDFNSSIVGLSTATEDFEGYVPGIKKSPFIFSNGTYNSTESAQIIDFNYFCKDGDQCLTNRDISGEKIFDKFLKGTTYWGVYMDFIDVRDPFNISVEGGSGVLSIDFTPNEQSYFLGFYDASYINSITIKNYGVNGNYSNYSFDDITTAAPSTLVTEPKTLILIIFSLLVLFYVRSKKIELNNLSL